MTRGAFIAITLAGTLALGSCGDPPDLTARAALPPIPTYLQACHGRAFPEIPAQAFGRREAVRIMAEAIPLGRAKAACGGRALNWMRDVVKAFGRPTS